jgi:hypothetical protein
MSILNEFADEKDVTTVINRETTKLVEGKQVDVESVIDTVDSIFYIGAQAEALVAEKIRSSVDAVCIVEYGTDIKKNDTLDINNKKYTIISDPDDPALRNEMFVCALKEVN